MKIPARVATIGGSQAQSPGRFSASDSAKNISLLRKPFSSGTPAFDAAATMARVAVCGMKRQSPLMRRISRVPVSWSMMPAAMNREALKVAWLITWKIAATAASWVPMPNSRVIRPS